MNEWCSKTWREVKAKKMKIKKINLPATKKYQLLADFVPEKKNNKKDLFWADHYFQFQRYLLWDSWKDHFQRLEFYCYECERSLVELSCRRWWDYRTEGELVKYASSTEKVCRHHQANMEYNLSLENATHRTIIMNSPYCFAHEVSNWKNCQLGEIVFLRYWKCICNNNLVEQPTRQPLNCRGTVKEQHQKK